VTLLRPRRYRATGAATQAPILADKAPVADPRAPHGRGLTVGLSLLAPDPGRLAAPGRRPVLLKNRRPRRFPRHPIRRMKFAQSNLSLPLSRPVSRLKTGTPSPTPPPDLHFSTPPIPPPHQRRRPPLRLRPPRHVPNLLEAS
jgi:hypothetical protein